MTKDKDYLTTMQAKLNENLDTFSAMIQGLFDYLIAREQSRADNKTTASSKEQIMKYQNIPITQKGGKSKLWVARVPLGKINMQYRYKYIYGGTQVECYAKLKQFVGSKAKMAIEIEKAQQLPEPKKVRTSKNTIRNFYDIYLNVYRKPYFKKTTNKNTESIWKNWISNSPLCDMPMETIIIGDIKTFLSTVEYPIQRNKIRLWLSNMFTCAIEHNLIKISPMAGLKLKKAKSKPRNNFYPDEEERFVQLAQKSEYWLIYALMLYEGLRPGEAKGIRPCDIKADYIEVSQAINDYGDVDSTKTGNIRSVPIFAQFRQLADKYRGNSDKTIFLNANKHTGNDEYRQLTKEAHIDKVMYCLRHTFATRCAEANISAKQVQLWMGHSDIETTLNYYTHISKEFEAENIKLKG